MNQGQFFAGVVRKKYKLFCVAPDGAQIEIATTHNEDSSKFATSSCQKILDLMKESFEMDEGFHMKIETVMESSDDIPLTEVPKEKSLN